MHLFLSRISILLFLNLLGIILFVSSVHSGQLIETFDIPSQPLEIGQGWDSQREQPTPGRCIIFSPVQARGQVTSVVIDEIDDASELAETLDISASGTADYLAGSNNISGQFIAKSNVSTINKNFSLHAQVRNGLLSVGPYGRSGPVRFNFPALDDPEPEKLTWSERLLHPGLDSDYYQIKLTKEALELLGKKNGQHEFLRYCGDSYVASISSGAEIHVLISHESLNSESNQHIEAHLKASYGMGSITGDVKSDIDETLAESNLSYRYTQIGGGDGILPIQKDDLAAKLHALQSEALRAPVFYELSAAAYQGLINWPDIDIDNPQLRDTTEKLVDLYLDITSLYTTYVDVWNERDAHFIVAYKHRQSMDRLSQCARTIQRVIAQRQHLNSQSQQSRQENVEPALQSSIQACPGLLPSNVVDDFPYLFPININPSVSKELEALRNDPEAQLDEERLKAQLEEERRKVREALFGYDLETQARMIADNYVKDWLLQFKLDLPLPQSQSMLSGQLAAEAIVERYLAKSARRACARNPSSDDCLSEQQLINYVQQVPSKKLIIDKSYTVKSAYQQGCWAMRSVSGELIMVLDNCKQREWDFSLLASGSMYIGEFCLINDAHHLAGGNAVLAMKCKDARPDYYSWHIDSLGRLCGVEGQTAPESCENQQCLSIQDDSDILSLNNCNASDLRQRWHSAARKAK